MSAPSRLALCLLAALALAAPAQAAHDGTPRPVLHAVTGVRAFTLLASESAGHEFARTPSFAWTPTRGVKRYEFELSTSRSFSGNSVIWSADNLTSPAVAIPISLPWITGEPYSLYAHVRAVTKTGAISPWSAPYGFNMRWTGVAQPLPSYPGLLRWTLVPGANQYTVWLVDVGKWFSVDGNVADEREYYSFHQTLPWMNVVHWRVRADRVLYGSTSNGLPAVSYGKWSPVYTSVNPPFQVGNLQPQATVGSAISTFRDPHLQQLMPGFAWTGNRSSFNGDVAELYRVYVFTDRDCLNLVYKGAIVGSPAYAPRPTGTLQLPHDAAGIAAARTSFLDDGTEGTTKAADGVAVVSSEDASNAGPAGDGSGSGTGGGTNGSGSSLPPQNIVKGARVDLWDNDWTAGGYYWTVMPVDIFSKGAVSTSVSVGTSPLSAQLVVASSTGIAAGDSVQIGPDGGSSTETAIVQSVSGSTLTLTAPLKNGHAKGEPVTRVGDSIEYDDGELMQDACASGDVATFAKSSAPTIASASNPFATGMSPLGRLVAAASKRPVFYGAPLVAWQPAPGALGYEVQWSRTRYPWRAAGNAFTYSTAVVLDKLKPGVWYYRVRGIDALIPSTHQEMTWSSTASFRVAKPTFKIVGR